MNRHVLIGDAYEIMSEMAPQSVDCIVTSPPYYGLRTYLPEDHHDAGMEIGREPTVDDYVLRLARTLGVACKRVLRDSGTLWLNIGDVMESGSLAMIPWKIAERMKSHGWCLRSAAPWIKRSPMPESARNRPSNGLEYVFMFTKVASGYYYDIDAVRKPVAATTLARDKYTRITAGKDGPYAVRHDHETPSNPKGRNRRNTDWWVETVDDEIVGYDCSAKAFRGQHFAVMPSGLIEPCILAGCPAGGVVLDPFCGSGTVLAVAEKLGRTAIGIDINEQFVGLAQERVV
jgi:site-specific DNA-methyltransferase (adenine-specific)